jgi:hypothetical protein
MTRPAGVAELDLLLIDGDNLLHGVRGSRDEGGVAWLLPRLSGWRPDHLRIVVGLDGHPPPGEGSRKRATRGIEFHHSRSRSADDLLIELLMEQPFATRSRIAVVTGDRGLQARAARAGGATRSIDWLMGEVTGSGSGAASAGHRRVTIGQGKPPAGLASQPRSVADEERQSWRPGRGATRKKGNPRRSPKGSRQG